MPDRIIIQSQSTELITGLVGIGGTIVGAFLSYFLQTIQSSRQEFKRVKSEFEFLRSSLLTTHNNNDCFLIIKNIRIFFIRNRNFIFQKEVALLWDEHFNAPFFEIPEYSKLLGHETLNEIKAMVSSISLDKRFMSERFTNKVKNKVLKNSKKAVS